MVMRILLMNIKLINVAFFLMIFLSLYNELVDLLKVSIINCKLFNIAAKPLLSIIIKYVKQLLLGL